MTGASDIGTLYLRNNTLKLSGALAEDTDTYEIATALITDQTNIDSLTASGNLLEIDQANLAYTRQGSLPDIGSFLRENLSSVSSQLITTPSASPTPSCRSTYLRSGPRSPKAPKHSTIPL